MPEPDYPRIAYEAWAAHQDWKDGDFDDIPRWDRLPQDLKDAWEAGIDAAFNAQIPGDAQVFTEVYENIPKPKAKRGSKAGY